MARPRVIDEYAAHGLCGYRIEVVSVLPSHSSVIDKTEVSLIY